MTSADIFNAMMKKYGLEAVVPEARPHDDIFNSLLPLLNNILSRLESLEKRQ